MRDLFDPVTKGLAVVLIDLGLDAVEPESIVGGATDRSHGDIAIPFHKFAGVLRRRRRGEHWKRRDAVFFP